MSSGASSSSCQQEGISVECQPPALRQSVLCSEQVGTCPGGGALYIGVEPCSNVGAPPKDRMTDGQTQLKTLPLPLCWRTVITENDQLT